MVAKTSSWLQGKIILTHQPNYVHLDFHSKFLTEKSLKFLTTYPQFDVKWKLNQSSQAIVQMGYLFDDSHFDNENR